jgi:acetoin utilization protein AcuB
MKQEYVRDWMTEDVITVKKGTALPDAHQLMTIKKIRRLPVVDDQGKLTGIITLGDVRGAEASPATSLSIWELNYLLSKLKVEQFMTPEPYTISPDTTIGTAARIMLENKVSGLPVVDDQRRLVGIITESDIFRLVVANEWEQQQQMQSS